MLSFQQNSADVAYMQWLVAGQSEEQATIRKVRSYYDGDHENQLTARITGYLQLTGNTQFNLNFCPVVVDAMKERMKIADIDCDQVPEVIEWVAGFRFEKELYLVMLRDGDAYLLVSYDSERGVPTFSLEQPYDGTNGVKVHYKSDGSRKIAYATKRWRVDDNPGKVYRRMNVYYPDRIEKYVSGSGAFEGGWEPWQDYEGEPWPLPWLDAQGNPLGVPVVHFPNNAGGYYFGRSELTDVIPAQDAINRAAVDLIAGAEVEGFRIVTLTGAEVDNISIKPGTILSVDAPDAAFGSIPSGNLPGLIENLDKAIMRFAQLSRTPLSYFQITGQVASAESQKAGASGLVSKISDRLDDVRDHFVDALRFAVKLSNVFGGTNFPLDPAIEVEFEPLETIDIEAVDDTRANTAKTKAETFLSLIDAGVPRVVAAELAGYSETQAQALSVVLYDTVTGIEQ